MKSIICKLQDWVQSQCDGDWEHHGDGIKIELIDNPGWGVDIDIRDTALNGRSVEKIEIERSDTDWLYCNVRDGKYIIRCGVQNLEEGLSHFLDWAK